MEVITVAKDPTVERKDKLTLAKDEYHLRELAQMLDAPQEKVRRWLENEGVEPVADGRRDMYRADALAVLRGREHSM